MSLRFDNGRPGTIRWGILGCGDVTEVKSGPGFQKATGSRLVAVMRRTAVLAEDYARRHQVLKWYGDADALIHDPEVDAIYVATPPDTHCEYALKVCAAGKPAYVEKPMARHATECERMVRAFAQAKLPLFVAFYRRGMPRFLQARELICAGALGRLTGVRYRYENRVLAAGNLPWRVNVATAGGGLFLDLGCHTLDLLDFLLGPLTEVAGVAANRASPYDAEDSIAMSFRAGGEIPGIASWNFAGVSSEDVIEVIGSEGRLSFSTFSSEPLRLETADGVETINMPPPAHVQQPLIQTVVDELLGRGTCPSTGETACRTARVMDRVLQGFYGGREEEFWLRPETWPGLRRK